MPANLMLDVAAYELSAEEKEILAHPYVGGLILFSRNYHDYGQLVELNRQIRHASKAPILIAVDHEGGRVQRFRDGFSEIPAMARFESLPEPLSEQLSIATEMGWLMAAEVQAADIDISFAPVLDVNGISEVIKERSFSADPKHVIKLASAFIKGMKAAGMACTGKHFPGHGSVAADSHIAMPHDVRSEQAIFDHDMAIFKQLMADDVLDAVMPAHVIYPDVDDKPAGFSKVWLQTILRQKLNFKGLIFSDDLSMEAASVAGSYMDKAHAALGAGCDMILACNNAKGAISILDNYQQLEAYSAGSIDAMLKTQQSNIKTLQRDPRWHHAQTLLDKFKG